MQVAGERKQSDTTYSLFFYMVDSADHIAGKTGLSPTVTLSKNGAAFASPAGAVSEIGSGWYKVAGNATDSNTLGDLLLHATATGADPADAKYKIVNYDPFTFLPAVNVSQWNGTNVTTPDVAGSPKVTITAGSGAGQLDFASGVVKANLAQILGTALTETAGQIAAAFKKFFNIATPVSTMDALTLVATTTTVTNRVSANTDQLAGQTVTAAAGVTFPASVASPTNITAGTITTVTNLTTNNDKTGYGLSAAAVQAIWDALTSALTTVGSIGKRLVDNLTGDIFARLGAPAGASTAADIAAVKVDTAAVKAKTDNLPANPAAVSDIPSAAAIVTAVLTTAMTESYAIDGAAPTLAQSLFMLLGKNYEFAIAADTLTVKKLDGSTSAMTFTLAPAGGPYTSITRSS